MARQRVIYVLEIKLYTGRRWFEIDCFLKKREAFSNLKIWVKNNPNDFFRVNEYYPRY